MAPQLTKTVDEATEQVVSLIEQAQEVTNAFVAQVSETVSQYLPDLGLGEVVLHPQDAIESSFKVSNRFVDAGRKAALGFVAATAPITEKIFGAPEKAPSPKAAPKSV